MSLSLFFLFQVSLSHSVDSTVSIFFRREFSSWVNMTLLVIRQDQIVSFCFFLFILPLKFKFNFQLLFLPPFFLPPFLPFLFLPFLLDYLTHRSRPRVRPGHRSSYHSGRPTRDFSCPVLHSDVSVFRVEVEGPRHVRLVSLD